MPGQNALKAYLVIPLFRYVKGRLVKLEVGALEQHQIRILKLDIFKAFWGKTSMQPALSKNMPKLT